MAVASGMSARFPNCLKIHLDNYMKEGEKITHCLMNAIDILMNEYKENEADVILALTINWIFASIDFFFPFIFRLIHCILESKKSVVDYSMDKSLSRTNIFGFIHLISLSPELTLTVRCWLLTVGRYQTPFT